MLDTGHPRGAVVVLVLLTAGCTGLVGGTADLTFTAGPVTVADAAVADSGFVVASDESFAFDESFEVAGEDRSVRVNADMVHLQRNYGMATPAHVVVLSTPDIELLGQQIELADRIGPLSLVDRASESVGELEREQKVRDHEVTVLGGPRTVEVYRGTAAQDGQEAVVLIFTASFTHDGDTIVVVGTTPVAATDDAEAAVLLAIEGIERGA